MLRNRKIERTLFQKTVNVFIIIGIAITLLVMLLVGFSQTETFREYARGKIITEINSSIKGNVNIERIDGTILTSLFLRNVSLTFDKDTVAFVGNIELKTSPLQLLLKRIYVRKLKLEDLFVNIHQYSDSTWNVDHALESVPGPQVEEIKVTPPDNELDEDGFSFSIVVNNFEIRNLSYRNTSLEFYKKEAKHDILNGDDMYLHDANLLADLTLDPSNNSYSAYIYHISTQSNFGGFQLLDFRGVIELNEDFASVQDMYMYTNRSILNMSARMDNFNLFGEVNVEEFEHNPIQLEMHASPFDFDDLTSWIGATDMLKGAFHADMIAEGLFGDINIEKFDISIGESNLDLKGRVTNLQTLSHFYIDAAISESELHYDDALNLLEPLQLPKFSNLYITNSSADFKGEPTKFITTLSAETEDGKFSGTCFLDLQKDDLEYDVNLTSESLNLQPIIGSDTKLNSSISIKGIGTTPGRWDSRLTGQLVNSTLSDYTVDTLNLRATALGPKADILLSSVLDKSSASISADFIYDENLVPSYSINGRIGNFDLIKYLSDSSYSSDFNFAFDFQGQYADLDSINGKFSVSMYDSYLNQRPLADAKIDLGITATEDNRSINLISDFADFNIYGKYNLSEVIELLGYEISTISEVIKDKSTDLNPFDLEGQDSTVVSVDYFPSIIDRNIEFSYLYNFKDLSLIALFMDIDELDISGYGEGTIRNDSLNFSISTGLYLDYLLFKENDAFYLTDFELDLNLSRNNRTLSFKDIFGTVSITGDELYAGTTISNLFADLTFNQKKLFFNTVSELGQDLNTEMEGHIDMSDTTQTIRLDRLAINFKNLLWENNSSVAISFNDEGINLNNLELSHEDAKLRLTGDMIRNGRLNLNFDGFNIPGTIISRYVLDSDQDLIKTNIEFSASITGTNAEPIIFSRFTASDFTYDKTDIGGLICTVDYSDGIFLPDLKLLNNNEKVKLSVSGKLPFYIGFGEPDKFASEEKIDLLIKTDSLNVNQFGNAIPYISDQEGLINADIRILGALDNLQYSGQIDIPALNFKSVDNNLTYTLNSFAQFENNHINIEHCNISNKDGSIYRGMLKGRGDVTLKGFNLEDLVITAQGDLAVLSRSSRGISPYIYGDLFVGTNGDLVFNYKNGNSTLNGSLLLKEMDLTYILGSSATNSANNKINYVILVDSSKLDFTALKIAEFVSNIEKDKNVQSTNGETVPFDFNLFLQTEKEAKLEFILSKALNQKLIVYATGDLDFRTINGAPNAQGEFVLQSGSKLEYFITFPAEGSLRFESDITDPYMDIVATYLTTYKFGGEEETPEDVAVKLKLKSRVSELGKNLASNPDNIGIYVGQRNIDNNIRDQRYDVSDALSLILVGNIKQDLSSNEKRNLMFQNTANSFLSSLVTNFINSAVGDYVSDIQINNSDARNLTVSGKIEKIRYKIGTSPDQINKTNLRIEYLFNPNFLIRLERKDPVVRTFAEQELIMELGLKYRFEF